MILPQTFYQRDNVVQIAKDLLGKFLVTNFDEKLTAGMIVETEAYSGVNDKASHASGGRFTKRTEIMYRQGGTAYVYLCYGVHSLFNIVTNKAGVADAVLIRGILPIDGLNIMLHRVGKKKVSSISGIGPGKVSILLGIHFSNSGLPITILDGIYSSSQLKIWVEESEKSVSDSDIACSPRVGVAYAGEDANLPWRFRLRS